MLQRTFIGFNRKKKKNTWPLAKQTNKTKTKQNNQTKNNNSNNNNNNKQPTHYFLILVKYFSQLSASQTPTFF